MLRSRGGVSSTYVTTANIVEGDLLSNQTVTTSYARGDTDLVTSISTQSSTFDVEHWGIAT